MKCSKICWKLDAKLVSCLLHQVTAAWHSCDLVQAASPQAFLEVLGHAAAAPLGAVESQAAGLGKLRDVAWRCELRVFWG